MAEVISNTSPLLYLYRIQAIDLLPTMFGGAWTSSAVVQELRAGRVWGTLRVLLEAKTRGLVENLTPLVDR
ncbi:MAG TPA: hypothetical protein VNW71_24820, partial [Thermoanaerobaculia bacterium]|nr:hypothetical protein [Thermoanaerobaculia bacterium]